MLATLKAKSKNYLKTTSFYSRYYPKFSEVFWNPMSRNEEIYSNIVNVIADKQQLGANFALIGEKFFDNGSIAKEVLEIVRERIDSGADDCINHANVVSSIKNADCSSLTSVYWKNLSFIANSFGLHQIGYALRSKSVEYLYSRGTGNKCIDEICELFAAAIDQGDYETAKHIMDKNLRISKVFFKAAKKADLFLRIVSGQEKKAQISKSIRSTEDGKFAEYLSGKTIAIVSPAQPYEKVGSEIDSYDIVVRINYTGASSLADKEFVGSKTSLSYYNGESGAKLLILENKDFIYELDYLVHKDEQNRLNMQDSRERAMHHFDIFMLHGSLNMIPNMILDLLMFEVKQIKVFNVNFFLSSTVHNKNYIGYKENSELLYSLAVHDKVTQINLIRNLWKRKIINVDNECERILMTAKEELMEEYCKLYPFCIPGKNR